MESILTQPASYNVIVVGAGGSGLAAALSAAVRGERVVLLQKQPQPGGTTGIAVGSFTAGATRMQRRPVELVFDSPEPRTSTCRGASIG